MSHNPYSIFQFIKFCLRHWLIGLGIGILVTISTVLWVLSLPNIYRSEITVTPTEHAQSSSISSSEIGGLASLAGISLGKEGISPLTIAIAIMESRQFAKNFIQTNDMAVPLLAATDWNPASSELLFNEEIYDINTSTWTREVSPPKSPEPTDFELYELYREALNIEVLDSGVVLISFEHLSPLLAAAWSQQIVKDINAVMREREAKIARNNIQFLQQQVDKAKSAELKTSMFALIQEQYEKMMLAEVNADFIFNIIDPAIAPEKRDSPNRSLIVIFAVTLTGFLLLCSYLMVFMLLPPKTQE